MTKQELQPLDDQFSAINHLSSLGDFLSQFSNSSNLSMSVKDTKTKTVLMSNTICNQIWGLRDDEIIGMTAREILTRIEGFVNVETILTKLEEAEKQAITFNQQANYTETALTYDGFVKIRRLTIMPISDVNGLPVATVGIGLDMTQNVNLLRLLDIYNLYYPQPKALDRFSDYLNLKRYFVTLPSFEELRTVLAMVRKPRHKDIAKSLNLALKTVSNYLCSVKDKLKSKVDLHMMLSSLRDHQQWEFEL